MIKRVWVYYNKNYYISYGKNKSEELVSENRIWFSVNYLKMDNTIE